MPSKGVLKHQSTPWLRLGFSCALKALATRMHLKMKIFLLDIEPNQIFGCVGIFLEICLEISPMDTFCILDAQCTGVWPRTTCINGRCECVAPAQPVLTRDGSVCVEPGAPASCPLPNLFPDAAALRESGVNSVAFVLCDPASTDLSPAGQTCRDTAIPAAPSMVDTYDCINGFCCPNRGPNI